MHPLVFAIALTLFAVAILIGVIVRQDMRKRRNRPERLRKLAALPLFYWNINRRTFFIVRADDRQKAISEHQEKVESGEVARGERIVYFVRPAITFSIGDDVTNHVQLGGRKELENLLGAIAKALPFSAEERRWVNGDLADEDVPTEFEVAAWEVPDIGLLSKAVKKDPFLFVPFSGDKPPVKVQEEMFPEPYLDLPEAREHLLRGIPQK